ncbi:MAG: thiamine pyrophosphate-dependent dehydrogenase E1 component subunit alpha [Deltaproteobacteria bacterium]|nr:MAG: thiamine pyrophosphate-dependent dehydrogenase E1 component subunit alpha [Deltaproteobacteria bacterium]
MSYDALQEVYDAQLLKKMYYYIVLTRSLENKISYICHSQNSKSPMIIGKGYLSTGQEAISVGACLALEDGDWLAPSHRDIGGMMVRGLTLEQIFLQYFCRVTSPTAGRDGNVHLGDTSKHILSFISHMGSIIAAGLGVAAAIQYREEKNVVLACFGDGASSQGVIHESMNYASVFKMPMVFVVNNNRYAISTSTKNQMAIENIAERAAGYGMPGVVVDGNHVTEVYQAVKKAVEAARAGNGPSLIECKTMRMCGHGTHDPANYVPKQELEEWKQKDPMTWFQNELLQSQVMKSDDIKSIQDQIDHEIEEAIEKARLAPVPQGEDLLRER